MRHWFWLQYRMFKFPLWAWLARRRERRVPLRREFGPFRELGEGIVSQVGDANADAADFDPPIAIITAKREEL